MQPCDGKASGTHFQRVKEVLVGAAAAPIGAHGKVHRPVVGHLLQRVA